MPKVSVIIPVYNVEKYLRECLDSVINQTLPDIEIICVNDASPDKCAEILNEYTLKDNRIKIITHTKNQGLGPARNTGVSIATAEFIVFIDSDDFVAYNMIEKLYKAITKDDADMAFCGNYSVTDEGDVIQNEYLHEGSWSVYEFLNNEQFYPGILPVWNKLFKKEYIKDIKQLPIISEDQPTIAEYLLRCQKVVSVSESLYYYRKRQGTLSNPDKNLPKVWDSFFYSHNLFFKYLIEKFHDQKALKKQIILRHFSLLWRIQSFRLIDSPGWKEHKEKLIIHLKADEMGLRYASPVMYRYLFFLFKIELPKKLKYQLVKAGIKLSRGVWLKRSSFILLPYDILKIIWPGIRLNLNNKLDTVEISFYKFIAFIYRKLCSRKIWLVGERNDTAQENGLTFYKFLKEEHPEEKSFYIIDFKSPQYENVKAYGNIVDYNCFIHKILFLASHYYVTAHNKYCYPSTFLNKKHFPLHSITKNVFIPHGITMSDVSAYYGKKYSDISLFICGAKPEYDFVKEYFGYTDDEVKYTGFATFDNLHDLKIQNQIILIPTWRRYIYEYKQSHSFDESVGFFRNTEYFMKFQSLINNNNLIALLETYGYKLIFYPHHEIQDFLSCFSTCSNTVIIASKEKYIVQHLLKDSALMITDTSSVSFDFAYMFKPLIYYQFDKENYYKTHLKPGYFDNNSMGFGEFVKEERVVISLIEKYLKNDCKMEELFVNRVKQFFPLHDNKNCERIFNAITHEYSCNKE
jgi:glycosyltransferase involved in cell wall biosynthesis/CDP-glycerol glycerophosphotransferase (TagB/SpsB family)